MVWMWHSVLYVPRDDARTHLNVAQTSSGEHEGKDQSESDEMGEPERETTVWAERKIISYKEGVKAKCCEVGLKLQLGQVAHAERLSNASDIRMSTSTMTGEDKRGNNQFSPDRGANTFISCIVDKAKPLFYMQTSESNTKSPLFGKLLQFDSAGGTKDQVQTCKKSNDPTVIDSEVHNFTMGLMKKITSNFGHDQISKASVNGKVQNNRITSEHDRLTNELGATQNFVSSYLSGKLSGVYNSAGQYLQSTQDIICQDRGGETSTCFQYMTIVQQKQLETSPKSKPRQNQDNFVNLIDNFPFTVPEKVKVSAFPGIAEGSLSTCDDDKPLVHCQGLVQFPKCLLTLQSLPHQTMLSRLYAVMPEITASCHQVLAIYWLSVASWKQPTPQPSCVLLTGTDLYAVSAGSGGHQGLAVFHHFSLLDVKEIQVGFAGQHVRLLESTGDAMLVIFTQCKELTQKLCRNLLRIIAPTVVQEGAEAHPFLQGDLSSYSLDWSFHVPDLVLDSGLRVTSRFKRNLADLLYIIHGNLEMTNRPPLADIHLLLYTCVRVENDCTSNQGSRCQFLLTDTHMSLVQEAAVFHPVPQGSAMIPPKPRFQVVELRRRSDIRCVFMRQSERHKMLDILFSTIEQNERKSQARKGLANGPVTSDRKTPTVWKLTFSCSSDATTLVDHLST